MGANRPMCVDTTHGRLSAHVASGSCGRSLFGGIGPHEGAAPSDGSAVLSHVRGWCHCEPRVVAGRGTLGHVIGRQGKGGEDGKAKGR